jgi:hypothetical protein
MCVFFDNRGVGDDLLKQQTGGYKSDSGVRRSPILEANLN